MTTAGVATLSSYFGVVVTTAVAAVGSVASRQFKSKQPKKKKVLSKKKKSSYRLAEAKSALGLSPSARFQTVVAATLRPSPPPSQSSPTKEEVKVECDCLARSVSSLSNRLEQNRSKLEELHVTKWKMLKKKDRQLVREKKKLKNIRSEKRKHTAKAARKLDTEKKKSKLLRSDKRTMSHEIKAVEKQLTKEQALSQSKHKTISQLRTEIHELQKQSELAGKKVQSWKSQCLALSEELKVERAASRLTISNAMAGAEDLMQEAHEYMNANKKKEEQIKQQLIDINAKQKVAVQEERRQSSMLRTFCKFYVAD